MNLDLAALTLTLSVQPQRNPWGHLGTWGTRASTRDYAGVDIGDNTGTSGDGCTAKVTNTDLNSRPSAASPGQCPRTSPSRPQSKETQALNEINVSPLSPDVPTRNLKKCRERDATREISRTARVTAKATQAKEESETHGQKKPTT